MTLKISQTITCGLAAMALMAAAGGVSAQTGSMSTGAMKSDKMASEPMKMSKADMKMMKKCQAMDHDKMMSDMKCKKMMDAHADMMKSDGMMKK